MRALPTPEQLAYLRAIGVPPDALARRPFACAVRPELPAADPGPASPAEVDEDAWALPFGFDLAKLDALAELDALNALDACAEADEADEAGACDASPAPIAAPVPHAPPFPPVAPPFAQPRRSDAIPAAFEADPAAAAPASACATLEPAPAPWTFPWVSLLAGASAALLGVLAGALARAFGG